MLCVVPELKSRPVILPDASDGRPLACTCVSTRAQQCVCCGYGHIGEPAIDVCGGRRRIILPQRQRKQDIGMVSDSDGVGLEGSGAPVKLTTVRGVDAAAKVYLAQTVSLGW